MLMKVVSRSTIVATIIAGMLASISATSVFAASGTGSSSNNTTGAITQNEIRDVQAESTFFSNLQKQHITLSSNASDRAQEQRWLQEYLFALARAQAIIGGHFSIAGVASKSSTSTSSSGTSSSGTTSSTSTSGSSATASTTTLALSKYYQNNPDKLLAMYLHMMRQLRQKLTMSQ